MTAFRIKRSDLLVAVATLMALQLFFLISFDKMDPLAPSAAAGGEVSMIIAQQTFHSVGTSVKNRPGSTNNRTEDEEQGALLPLSGSPLLPDGDLVVGDKVLFPEHYADRDAHIRFMAEDLSIDNVATGKAVKSVIGDVLDAVPYLVDTRRDFLEQMREKQLPPFAVVSVMRSADDVASLVALAHNLRKTTRCLQPPTSKMIHTEQCMLLLLDSITNKEKLLTPPQRMKLLQSGWQAIVPVGEYDHRSLFVLQVEKAMYVSPFVLPFVEDLSQLFFLPTLMPAFERTGEGNGASTGGEESWTLTIPCVGRAVDEEFRKEYFRRSAEGDDGSDLYPVSDILHVRGESEKKSFFLKSNKKKNKKGGETTYSHVIPLLFVAFSMKDAITTNPELRCDVDHPVFKGSHRLLNAMLPNEFTSDASPIVSTRLDYDWLWSYYDQRNVAGKGSDETPDIQPLLMWYDAATAKMWADSLQLTTLRNTSKPFDDEEVHDNEKDVENQLVAADNVIERVWVDSLEDAAHRVVKRATQFAAMKDIVSINGRSSGSLLKRSLGHMPWQRKKNRVARQQGFKSIVDPFFIFGARPNRPSSTTNRTPPRLAIEDSTSSLGMSAYSQLQYDANLTIDGMIVVSGEAGDSCIETCSQQQVNPKATACVPAALKWWRVNSCEALTKHTSCSGACIMDLSGSGTSDAKGRTNAVVPAMRVSDSMCTILNLRSPVSPSCSAKDSNFARVCGCLDPKKAPTADIVRFDDKNHQVDHVAPPTPQPTEQFDAPNNAGIDSDGGQHEVRGNHELHQKDEEDERPEDCPCHPQGIAPVTEDQEQRCMEYLANFSNVKAVDALISDLRLGRTVKFRLTYHHKCVRAIAKVPQSLFPLEPYAEYTSFEVDRLLKLNMIPPTTWIFIPMASIENAAISSLNVASSMGSVEAAKAPDAADSGDAEGPHEYSKWVAKEVMMYALNHNLIVTDPSSGRMVLGCSVQLWLSGVEPVHRSPLAYDESYNKLLTGDRARQLRNEKLFNQPAVKNILKKRHSQPVALDLMRYLSDTCVFDSIIANDDRGSIKNSNVMKIVGLSSPGDGSKNAEVDPQFKTSLGNEGEQQRVEVASKGHIIVPPNSKDEATGATGYLFVHLDQGKSFYKEALLDKYLLDDDHRPPHQRNVGDDEDMDYPPGICMFSNQTYTTLKTELHPAPKFFETMKDILPALILKHVTEQRLRWAQARIAKIVAHMDRCVKALGEDTVLAFP